MPTIESPAESRRPAAPADGWPDVVSINVWIVQEPDRWIAIASEFDIVGMGESESAALHQLVEMVCDYLNSSVADGLSFEQALRPLPLSERVRLRARAVASGVLRRFSHARVSHEGKFLLPHHFNGQHASC